MISPRYLPYWKSYSSNGGRSWSKPAPIAAGGAGASTEDGGASHQYASPPGCARPWMLVVGKTLLLTGGRDRSANTTDTTLWSSTDYGDTWLAHSISGYHNMLVANDTYHGFPSRHVPALFGRLLCVV